MKSLFQAVTYLLVPMALISTGCEKKESAKELHFGPSPGDGEMQGDTNARELHFGPSPGDGVLEEGEENFHFGTSPGDG